MSKFRGVVVMYFSAAALSAFESVFKNTRHILCIVHIRNNFKKNCLKRFDVEEQQKVLMNAVDHIINSTDEKSLHEAKVEFTEIAYFSRKGTEIMGYLEWYGYNIQKQKNR